MGGMEGQVDNYQSIKAQYQECFTTIEQNPFSPKVWRQAVGIAKREEGSVKANEGYYGSIPLDVMTTTAQRLRKANQPEDKWTILAEKSPTGELWYDVILGRVNNKILSVMGEDIGTLQSSRGLSFGQRKWGRALDIGTGTGNSLKEIQKYADDVVGIDPLHFLLRKAKANPQLATTSMVTGDALTLPFADEMFDLATSSGVTAYIGKSNLSAFVNQVDRILEPGGSYFQAYPLPPGKDGVLKIEKEYLSSGKSLLVCLMDRMVTHQIRDENTGESEFSVLSGEFKKHGFIPHAYMHKDKGVVVLEFKKPYSDLIQDIQSEYESGARHEAAQRVYYYLYGDAAIDIEMRGIVNSEKLPSEEQLLKRLREFQILASDPEIIDWNSHSDYMAVFIDTLTDVVQGDFVNPKIRDATMGVLVRNLEHLRARLANSENKQHYSVKETLNALRSLEKSLNVKPWCKNVETIVQQIISENSMTG